MNLALSKPFISDMINLKRGVMPRLLDLTGKIFGRLTVIGRHYRNIRNRPAWNCTCKCGNGVISASRDLVSGDKKSCGCLRKDLLRKDLSGNRFGKLVAIEHAEKKGKSSSQFWRCTCDCGRDHVVSSQHLIDGHVTHCRNCPIKSEEYLLEEAKERFHKSYEKKDGCWIWNKSIVRRYGMMFFKKPIRAHRFSYMIYHGELQDGMYICHRCDNPLCVNPDCLYQGTPKDNARDALERNRYIVGEENNFSKLTEEQVIHIISSDMKGVELAKLYGVDKNTISKIRMRKQWKHLT